MQSPPDSLRGRQVKGRRANICTYILLDLGAIYISSKRNLVNGTRMPVASRPDIQPLCDVHFRAMLVVNLEGSDGSRWRLDACSDLNCSRHYSPEAGYFDVNCGSPPGLEEGLKMPCPDDLTFMYLKAHHTGIQKDLWRCARVDCGHRELVPMAGPY